MAKIYVDKIWIDGKTLYAMAESGDIAQYDLTQFKGFRNATQKQLDDFEVVSPSSIYWPSLDEDINLEGMFYDNHLCKLTPTEDGVVYAQHP